MSLYIFISIFHNSAHIYIVPLDAYEKSIYSIILNMSLYQYLDNSAHVPEYVFTSSFAQYCSRILQVLLEAPIVYTCSVPRAYTYLTLLPCIYLEKIFLHILRTKLKTLKQSIY